MNAEDFIVIPEAIASFRPLSRNPEGLENANVSSAVVPGFRLIAGTTGTGDSSINSRVADCW